MQFHAGLARAGQFSQSKLLVGAILAVDYATSSSLVLHSPSYRQSIVIMKVKVLMLACILVNA